MAAENPVKRERKGKDGSEEANASEMVSILNTDHCGRFSDRQIKKKRNLCEYQIFWKMFKGLFYTFFGCLCIDLLNVIAKKSENIDPGQLSMTRHVGMCFGSLPFVIFTGKKIIETKGKGILLIVRAMFGSFSFHLTFLSCRLLPLAVVSIIMSATPTVTMIIAKIFLKEPCGIISGLAAVVTFCGVILSTGIPAIIAEEGFHTTLDTNHLLGLACACGFVLVFSVTIVLQRALKDIHFSVVVFSIGSIGIIQNAAITAAFGSFSLPHCGMQRMLFIVIAVLGFSAQYFRTTAVNIETAGNFILMKSCFDVVIAMILQIIFFAAYPDVYTISGGILVLSSIAVIALNKSHG